MKLGPPRNADEAFWTVVALIGAAIAFAFVAGLLIGWVGRA